MEQFFLICSTFLLWFAFLVGLYFFLLLLSGLVGRAPFLGSWQQHIGRLIQFVLDVYEPIALIVLAVVFVLFNPWVNGGIVAALVLLGYQPLKNYVSGRIFILTNEIRIGQRIEVKNHTGIIQKIERLGLILQSQEGMRFVNYSSLLSEGFVLLKGEKVGGLHQLQLRPLEENQKNHQQFISNRLFSCPYVDWSFRPEISLVEEAAQQYDLRVLVREEQHLGHLLRLVKEWGYECVLND